MAAYVSSPELTFGILFALEEPDRIADVVKSLIDRKTVSIFMLAKLSDGTGPAGDQAQPDNPPQRYVVNWAAVPQVTILPEAPNAAELRAEGTMLINAFLGDTGEVTLYSAGH